MLVRKVWQRDRFTAKKVLLKGTAIAEKGDYNRRKLCTTGESFSVKRVQLVARMQEVIV